MIDATGEQAIDILFLGGIKEVKIISEKDIINTLKNNINGVVSKIISVKATIDSDHASVMLSIEYITPRYYKTIEDAKNTSTWDYKRERTEEYKHEGNKRDTYVKRFLGSDSELEGLVEVIRKND